MLDKISRRRLIELGVGAATAGSSQFPNRWRMLPRQAPLVVRISPAVSTSGFTQRCHCFPASDDGCVRAGFHRAPVPKLLRSDCGRHILQHGIHLRQCAACPRVPGAWYARF